MKQHLDSFNYFVNTEIKKIVRANDRIESSIDPSIYLRSPKTFHTFRSRLIYIICDFSTFTAYEFRKYEVFILVGIFFCCRFLDVRIGEPSVTMDGVSEKLNPQTCRLSDIT